MANAKESAATPNAVKPVKVFRLRGISASVFENLTEVSGGAKLWEWSANTQGAIFTLLLRKSDDRGGGDFREATFETDPEAFVGRWAGDHVVLVGDYDSSGLYEKSKRFRNISHELAEVWNQFVPLGDKQLTLHKSCSCQHLDN